MALHSVSCSSCTVVRSLQTVQRMESAGFDAAKTMQMSAGYLDHTGGTTHAAASGFFFVARVDSKVSQQIEKFAHVVDPVILAKNLMLDTTSQLGKMTASVGYSDDKDFDFGDEFREAEQLNELPE